MWLAFHDLFKTSQCFTEENLLKRKKQKLLKKKVTETKGTKEFVLFKAAFIGLYLFIKKWYPAGFL